MRVSAVMETIGFGVTFASIPFLASLLSPAPNAASEVDSALGWSLSSGGGSALSVAGDAEFPLSPQRAAGGAVEHAARQ